MTRDMIRFRRLSARRVLALAVSTAMLASACSATGTGSSSSLTQGDAALAAGTEPAYAATSRPKLQQIFADTLTPGAVVLVRSPELGDWAATFGTRTLGGRVPVTLADHVRIGSNTKTWTGTVILQLVQEGKLRLDDPVSKYRPDVPNGQNITITHLLDMRSGLYNYSESLELNQTLDTNPAKAWTPDELLGIAYKYRPYFPPGQGYHYSNTNTVLLGADHREADRQAGRAGVPERASSRRSGSPTRSSRRGPKTRCPRRIRTGISSAPTSRRWPARCFRSTSRRRRKPGP